MSRALVRRGAAPRLGVLVLVLGAACAAPPPIRRAAVGVDVPARWSGAAPGVAGATAGTAADSVPVAWWRGFGDPGLERAVAEALAHNTDLLAAAARLEAAAAAARVSTAALVPSLDASGQGARRRQNLIGIPIPGFGGVITTRTNSFGVSLDTQWELDLWGRVRTTASAGLADLQARAADLAAARLSIAGQTAKAYFAAVEAALQVRLAEETVASYRESAERVRARYRRGIADALDLRLALSNLAAAESMLEARRVQRDRAGRQLEILLGRYPAGRAPTGDDLPVVRGAVPAGLPSGLLLRRPDLLAAERRYAAALRRVRAARRAFFPRITLTGSAGTASDQLADLLDGDFSVWSIAAGVVQPLFRGGRLRADLAQSHAAADQALAAYAGALLRAFGEVESGLFTEAALARRETAAREAAEQAEAARSLAQRRYREGLGDYVTVLEAQRRALTARSEWLSVRRERLDARVDLVLALGGGFRPDENWARFLAPEASDPPAAAGAERNPGGPK